MERIPFGRELIAPSFYKDILEFQTHRLYYPHEMPTYSETKKEALRTALLTHKKILTDAQTELKFVRDILAEKITLGQVDALVKLGHVTRVLSHLQNTTNNFMDELKLSGE